jgi:hypothetical protein
VANFGISKRLLDFLRKREGIIPYVYDDGRGARGDPEKDRARGRCVASWNDFKRYPTIAMGLRIYPKDYPRFTPYLNCNRVPDAMLDQLIQEPLIERQKKLNDLIGDAPATQAMFDALFSMGYNTGFGNGSFKKAVAALVDGDFKAAQDAIAKGPTTSKGKQVSSLAERRKLEAEMFMADGLPSEATAMTTSGETVLAVKKKTRKRKKWALWLAIGGSAVLLLVGGFAFLSLSKSRPAATPMPTAAAFKPNRRRRRR